MQQQNDDMNRFYNLLNVDKQTNISGSEYHKAIVKAYADGDDAVKAALNVAIQAIAGDLTKHEDSASKEFAKIDSTLESQKALIISVREKLVSDVGIDPTIATDAINALITEIKAKMDQATEIGLRKHAAEVNGDEEPTKGELAFLEFWTSQFGFTMTAVVVGHYANYKGHVGLDPKGLQERWEEYETEYKQAKDEGNTEHLERYGKFDEVSQSYEATLTGCLLVIDEENDQDNDDLEKYFETMIGFNKSFEALSEAKATLKMLNDKFNKDLDADPDDKDAKRFFATVGRDVDVTSLLIYLIQVSKDDAGLAVLQQNEAYLELETEFKQMVVEDPENPEIEYYGIKDIAGNWRFSPLGFVRKQRENDMENLGTQVTTLRGEISASAISTIGAMNDAIRASFNAVYTKEVQIGSQPDGENKDFSLLESCKNGSVIVTVNGALIYGSDITYVSDDNGDIESFTLSIAPEDGSTVAAYGCTGETVPGEGLDSYDPSEGKYFGDIKVNDEVNKENSNRVAEAVEKALKAKQSVLAAKVEILKKQIDALHGVTASLDKSMADSEAKAEDLTKKLKGIEDDIKKINSEITQKSEERESAQKFIDKVDSEVNGFQFTIDGCAITITDGEAKVSELESIYPVDQAKIDDLNAGIAQCKKESDEAEKAKAALQEETNDEYLDAKSDVLANTQAIGELTEDGEKASKEKEEISLEKTVIAQSIAHKQADIKSCDEVITIKEEEKAQAEKDLSEIGGEAPVDGGEPVGFDWNTFGGTIYDDNGVDYFHEWYVGNGRDIYTMMENYPTAENFYAWVREGIAEGGTFNDLHEHLSKKLDWDEGKEGSTIQQQISSGLNNLPGRPGDEYYSGGMGVWTGINAS